MELTLRDIEAADFTWALALNQEHATELSPLTPDRLRELVATAFYARVVDGHEAFLIAFDQDAGYDSPNFLWFQRQLDRFVYVDRVVVAVKHRGAGLAKALYQDLFSYSQAARQAAIVCEVNADPPNPGSDAFHAALGFSEVGLAELADRGKHVRYLRRDL